MNMKRKPSGSSTPLGVPPLSGATVGGGTHTTGIGEARARFSAT